MKQEQFEEYERILDNQNKLILKLNSLKERREELATKLKQTKNFVLFEQEISDLELESELLLKKMQENLKKAKELQSIINSENK